MNSAHVRVFQQQRRAIFRNLNFAFKHGARLERADCFRKGSRAMDTELDGERYTVKKFGVCRRRKTSLQVEEATNRHHLRTRELQGEL